MTKEEFNELIAKVESAVGEKVDSAVIEALKDNGDFATAKSVADAYEAIKETQERVARIADDLEKGKKDEPMDMAQFLASQKDVITSAKKNRTGFTLRIPEKVVRPVMRKADLLRAGIATNTYALDIPGVGQLDRSLNTFYDFARKIPVSPGQHNGTVRYLDWVEGGTTSAGASVAENVAFPESTAAFAALTMSLEKVGDTLPVTDEFFYDETQAAAELNRFLELNVMDAINTGLITGNGTPPNLNSLVSRSTAFVAAAEGLVAPNLSDLILRNMEAIGAASDAKYGANFAIANIAEWTGLRIAKATDGQYVFQGLNDRIPEITTLQDNSVVANTLYVGDANYCAIYEEPGIDLQVGYVGDDFAEGRMTIRADKRLNLLIRNADQTGFRSVASVSAALTTLGT